MLAQSMQRRSRLALNVALCLGFALGGPGAMLLAQPTPAEKAEKPLPADTAILQLAEPGEATLSVNGTDYGKQRSLEFPGLEPGQIYRYQIDATLAHAKRVSRTVLLRGGWRVRLSLQGPRGDKPELMPKTGHALSVWAAAFSPDGQYLLTGSMDMSAVVWDASNGRQLRVLRSHQGPITSAAFTPDGTQAVTASFDSSAVLWDPRTGAVVRKFRKTLGQPIWSVAFTPDGKRLLTDEILWDVASGEKLFTLAAPAQSVRAGALSRDGRLAATAGIGAQAPVALWDTQTGDKLRTLAGNAGNTVALAFRPDGQQLLTGTENRQVALWDVQTGQQIRVLEGHAGEVKSVAFSPDGRYVLSGSLDQTAIVWDAESGKRLHTWRPRGRLAGQDKVWAVGFSADGRRAVAGVGHNSAVVWDMETKAQQLTLEGATTVVGAAAFDDQGRHARIVVGLGGMTWDARTGRPSGNEIPLSEVSSSPITSVAFDRDARHILVSLQDKTDYLFDAQAGRKLQVFRDHAGGLSKVAVSPDGRRALTGSSSNMAYLWDVASGKRNDLAGHAATPFAVAVSADGRYAVTGGFDNAAIVWDMTTRQKLQTLQAHAGIVTAAIRPDGKQVLLGTWDNTGALWDVASAKKLHTLTGHEGWIWSAGFSPDQRYLLTGGFDNKINLWNAATGDLLRTFTGHSGWVTGADLSPDNRYLLSSSFDGTARLWDVATGQDLASLVGLNAGKDWLVVTPDGLFDGSRLGREMVSFRFGGALNVVPVDRFFQDFYRPGLLSELWRGARPAPELRLGANQPPAIRLLEPREQGKVRTNRVTIEAEVRDQGGGVLGPWLLQNGARVLTPGSTVREGKLLRRRFDVTLVEGENRFEIRAASADGSWEGEPALLTLIYAGSLPPPKLHVLTVSIDRYADESLSLNFPARDAAAMADLFRQRGAGLYAQVNVTRLADQQATKAGIVQAIRDVGRATQPQDTLLVFMTGQGLMAGNQYYFFPREFPSLARWSPDELNRHAIPAADVGEAMAASAALKRVLVCDTGQSGRPQRAARNPFALRGAIERLSRTQGAFTIAAAPVSDPVGESADLKHGVLAYTLLAGLRAVEGGPLANQWIETSHADGIAHVLEWFGFASTHVPELTAKLAGQKQDVQYAGTGVSFPLLPVPRSAETPAREAQTPRPAEKPAAQPVVTKQFRSEEAVEPCAVHLVAVGVNQYRQTAMNLRYASADATAMADLFRRRSAGLYADLKIHLVLDQQATRAGILETVQKVAQAARPEDFAVLFLAGHGAMVGQRYYFIPHEFQRQAGSLEDDIRTQGIPADALADALAQVQAQKQILILDTCASGSMLESGRKLRDPVAFRSFIDRLGQRQGVFTIAAAAAGDEAQEIEELSHGALTYALLAALRAVPPGPLEGRALHPGNARGLADVMDWFSFASGHVPHLTERFLGKEQAVQTSGQGRSFAVLPAWE